MIADEVPAALGGERLDRVVALMADVSRAAAADLIADGAVQVNGEVETRRGRQLAPGDVVTLGGLAARVATGEVEIDVPW